MSKRTAADAETRREKIFAIIVEAGRKACISEAACLCVATHLTHDPRLKIRLECVARRPPPRGKAG